MYDERDFVVHFMFLWVEVNVCKFFLYCSNLF
jgi:hypothetical protein